MRPWKPDVCEEPGCTRRWPSFSRDGGGGPWRCQEHDRTATKRPDQLTPGAPAETPPRLL